MITKVSKVQTSSNKINTVNIIAEIRKGSKKKKLKETYTLEVKITNIGLINDTIMY